MKREKFSHAPTAGDMDLEIDGQCKMLLESIRYVISFPQLKPRQAIWSDLPELTKRLE